ncbi:MAG: peptidase S8 and S53 subtilisin kexin sedolisin [Stygiobacter sp.]|nr:MAG: peptidase S8 and S53 subtilisin kexin sedolisin [Stygiobacter sp.]KAF0211281.1 MAG: peptidase S8 and S53 subtilisin kexin [Ignavibacteria bacterium]
MKKVFIIHLVLLISSINYVYCENYFGGSKGSNGLYRWSTNNIHYRVDASGASDNGLDYNATAALIQAAYNAWDNVSTSSITFTFDGSVSGNDSYDGTNGHYWLYPPNDYFTWVFYDDPNTPQIEGASALTVFEDYSNVLTDVDIVYNGNKEWKGTDYMTWWNEVESVAIHEIGHSLGIAHADNGLSPIPVMTYAADPSSDRKTLKFDDTKAVSFLYGGNLIDNETFSGTNYFAWNISISSGKTLTFQAGSSINFSNSSSLTINGTLSAVGTSSSGITFTSSGSWGGIQFNSGSSGNMDYCTVQYAGNGIYCYNSSPTIKHSTMDNNSSTGLYLNYYSSPVLVGNNFRFNSSYGIRCESYSSPDLTDNGYPGSNVIRNNGTGILTSYYSNPNLNGYMTYGNSVFDNTGYEVSANTNCTISAQRVYWGSGATYYTSGSTIDYTNPLGSNPNPGRSVVADNSSSSSNHAISLKVVADDLSPALDKQKDKKYDEAIPLFLEIFKNNKDALLGKYALSKIEECYTQAGKKDYLDYSKREIKPQLKEGSETYVEALELEAHQMVNLGLYKEAVNNLETILKKYNLNSEIEKNTLFTLGAFHNIFFGDKANSDKYFEELKQKYPNDDLVNQIEIIKGLGLAANSSVQGGDVVLPFEETSPVAKTTVSEDAITNYPNPFNPSTKISFTLKEGGKVSLKVYDVLGKEVANLADGVFETGKHETTFNGSNLASGIYFYRIVTPKATITKKMMLMK